MAPRTIDNLAKNRTDSAMSSKPFTFPELDGKSVLITGASTGIGAALAKAFAAQGAKVGVHYNSSQDAAENLAAEIEEAGGTTVLVRADACDSAAFASAVDEAAEKLGGLNGLINNAGGMVKRVPYEEATDADYDRVMDLNARSVLTASRAALPYLKKQGGFVINTTSIAARNGAGGGAGLYGSSKSFVSNVTRGMAKEWISYGIRVNAVSPGVIETLFHERYSTKEQMDTMLATVPQGRLGSAEDCVGAFLFLASEALAGYIIGQVIEVNGGQLMP
ncbi:SDR family oxidoreductase [uncultured Jannaschia sp.]|uniref:SDR family NAD(P)-dependent oxidoreductase n=1 Tax=uncultured Jannaschia sp. TaxID=293347 RepID=UPI00260613B7|nr:SDR family oxidoreductase [uncultured Jannaschia sp.]